MQEVEDREATRRNPLLWPIRFLLHLIIKVVVLFVMGIRFVLRPRPVRFGLAALIVLGVVAWNLAGTFFSVPGLVAPTRAASAPAAVSTTQKVSVPAPEKLDPPPAVENYLQAQANFDANGMWAMIGDDMKQQLAASNTTEKELQSELDQAKQSGRKYGQAMYIGGATLEDSTKAYFYVLTVDTPNGTIHVPYTYVVNSDDKIESIQ